MFPSSQLPAHILPVMQRLTRDHVRRRSEDYLEQMAVRGKDGESYEQVSNIMGAIIIMQCSPLSYDLDMREKDGCEFVKAGNEQLNGEDARRACVACQLSRASFPII